MKELVANKSRRRLIFAGILVCASVLLALVFANIFPDQTWATLNAAETVYAETVSRMIPVPTGAPRSIEEDRIREAVLRYLIASTVRLHVFLKIDGKDPSDKFMAQFADLNPAVKKGSEAECTIRGCCDRSSGERAVVLSVSSIKWSFGDRVEVSGGYQCGPLCGSGGVFEVVKNSGNWKVQSYSKQWDS
jgi:hypothetical protein